MKCLGCGVKVQSTDPNLPGYVSEIHIIENGDNVYCKRCFDVIHYNRRYTVPPENKAFIAKMKSLQKNNSKDVILLMVDVLDIYGGFIDGLNELIGNLPVIVLINKIDLMPKSIKLKHLELTTREIGKSLGLNIISVYPISAKSKKNIETVVNKIDKLRYSRYSRKTNFDNCYVVGCASVGKSTLINSLREMCFGENLYPITTSDQFQTTLDLIKIELGNKFFIYDTPGIINQKSFNAYLNYDSVKILTPKTYLKVRTYQLKNNQTIYLGGLVRTDFTEGENISVSCFVSNQLYVHRTKTEQADHLYETQTFKMLVPPLEQDELDKLGNLKTYELDCFENNKFYDIIIPGVGFLHVKGDNLKIKLTLSEKVSYRAVESFL